MLPKDVQTTELRERNDTKEYKAAHHFTVYI